MSELAGPSCPECGKPRAVDGTPTCSCARRASDVHRETRTADAAAAEDFDPVRIRPFVDIAVNSRPAEASTARTEAEGTHLDTETAEGAEGGEGPQLPDESGGSAEAATPAAEDGPVSLSRGEPLRHPASDGEPTQRRRPRALLVTGAGAAVAVVVSGGIVGGLFWYDNPSRDGAVSGGVRAGLPQERPSKDGPSSRGSSRTASPAQSSETSPSSPTSTSTGVRATPTGAGGPSASAPGATSTATASGAPAPSESGGGAPVLSLGDSGPEVVELQLRLRQAGYYRGEADGDYDREVENAVRGYQLTRVILKDEPGVYGAATRASLESETTEP